MRLATYLSGTQHVPAIVIGTGLCPLAEAVNGAGLDTEVDATSVRRLLATSSEQEWARITASAEHLVAAEGSSLDAVALLAPIPDPQKILCLALNSQAHCAEVGVPEPEIPWFFPKSKGWMTDELHIQAHCVRRT